MNEVTIKTYSGTPFSVSCEPVQNRPGTWNSTKVSIYWGEEKIGEYLRNYSSHAAATFYPFMQDGQWFALYSAEYTALRVMKLHNTSIEDWCGDSASSNGFCPVEVYIPKYHTMTYSYTQDGVEKEFEYVSADCDVEDTEFAANRKEAGYKHTTYCTFAFMCGCVWGDDTSWKIRYIDLTEIKNKKLIITEKFGYWEMPDSLTLKQCVSLDCWEPGHDWIKLTRAESINLATDERC